MRRFTAYIDEAGDEGIGKLATSSPGGQSRWLILGASIVSRENDLKLPLWRDDILKRFPKRNSRDLHFRNLKHEQKVVVSQMISQLPLGACLAFSNKATISGSKWESTFKKPGYLYNYLLRYLLERITEVCARRSAPEGASVHIVFSRRGGTDYQGIREYLQKMRSGDEYKKPVRPINWNVLDPENISVENHSKWAGLQMADCITSAFFTAVEPNNYGNYESRYAEIMRGNLLRDSNGIILNCGVTPVPSLTKSACDPSQLAFFQSYSKK